MNGNLQSDGSTGPAGCGSDDAVCPLHPLCLFKNVSILSTCTTGGFQFEGQSCYSFIKNSPSDPHPTHTDFTPLPQPRLCCRITNLFPGFFYPPHCKRPNPSKLKALIRLDSMTDELVFQAKLILKIKHEHGAAAEMHAGALLQAAYESGINLLVFSDSTGFRLDHGAVFWFCFVLFCR